MLLSKPNKSDLRRGGRPMPRESLIPVRISGWICTCAIAAMVLHLVLATAVASDPGTKELQEAHEKLVAAYKAMDMPAYLALVDEKYVSVAPFSATPLDRAALERQLRSGWSKQPPKLTLLQLEYRVVDQIGIVTGKVEEAMDQGGAETKVYEIFEHVFRRSKNGWRLITESTYLIPPPQAN
jgi:ketosteroid isomerase-like protein